MEEFKQQELFKEDGPSIDELDQETVKGLEDDEIEKLHKRSHKVMQDIDNMTNEQRMGELLEQVEKAHNFLVEEADVRGLGINCSGLYKVDIGGEEVEIEADVDGRTIIQVNKSQRRRLMRGDKVALAWEKGSDDPSKIPAGMQQIPVVFIENERAFGQGKISPLKPINEEKAVQLVDALGLAESTVKRKFEDPGRMSEVLEFEEYADEAPINITLGQGVTVGKPEEATFLRTPLRKHDEIPTGDITPPFLSDQSDEVLAVIDQQLHERYEKNQDEDLVNAHLYLFEELLKRDLYHFLESTEDELNKSTRSFANLLKDDSNDSGVGGKEQQVEKLSVEDLEKEQHLPTVYKEYPDTDQRSFPWVAQNHYRGPESVHLDFRFLNEGQLIGWTVTHQTDRVNVPKLEELDTAFVEVAREYEQKNPGAFKIDPTTGAENNETGQYLSIPKDPHPRMWLDTEGVVEPGGFGATENLPAVFNPLFRGEYNVGARRETVWEVFVDSEKVAHPQMEGNSLSGKARLLWFPVEQEGDVGWMMSLSDSQLPYVLSDTARGEDWVPPEGWSGLPTELEQVIEDELKYWESSDEQARVETRNDLYQAWNDVGVIDLLEEGESPVSVAEQVQEDELDKGTHFGTRLKRFREENEMSQKELADKVGISSSMVGALERGERFPGRKAIQQLAEALEITIEELWGAELDTDGVAKNEDGDVEISIMKRRTIERQDGSDAHIIVGIAYQAYDVDADQDWTDPEGLRDMAHSWAKNGFEFNVMHRDDTSNVQVLESSIRKQGEVVEGEKLKNTAWIVKAEVTGSIWERIKKGELNGFSIEGRGARQAEPLENPLMTAA